MPCAAALCVVPVPSELVRGPCQGVGRSALEAHPAARFKALIRKPATASSLLIGGQVQGADRTESARTKLPGHGQQEAWRGGIDSASTQLGGWVFFGARFGSTSGMFAAAGQSRSHSFAGLQAAREQKR